MLAPKLILSGLGLVAFAGAAYQFIPSGKAESVISDKDARNVNYSYFLVTAIAPDSGKSETSSDFFNTTTTTKNYFCSFEGNSQSEIIKDETCEIYDLNKETAANEQIIDLYQLEKNSSNQLRKSKPEATKKYILKINSEKYGKIKTNNKEVKIIQNETDKQFIKLNEEYKLTNVNGKFKTNIILVKVTNTPTASTPSSNVEFQCKFKSATKVDCSVFKLSTNPAANSEPDVNGDSKLTKLTSVTTSLPANNDYLIIEIRGDNNYKTEKELRSFSPEIYVKSNSASSANITTEYISSYVGKITESGSNINSKLLKFKASPQDYLVVVHDLTTPDNQKATSDFKTGDNKNYKCELDNTPSKKTDEKCLLFPITITNPITRSVNLSDVENANTEATSKNVFAAQKYFKLVVTNQEFINKNYSESDLITIASKKTDETDKSYGKVKVISKFSYQENIAQTSLFLAKIKTPSTSTSTTTFKCKYDKDQYADCDIYKTTTSLNENIYKNADLSQFTKASVTHSDLVAGKYLIIDLKTSKKPISEFNDKVIGIANGAESSEITNLADVDIVAPIYATISSDLIQTGSVMFIK